MLTGDENIVDVSFVVYWRIRTDKVQDYLFNIQQPETTVSEVAESAMREVVGQSMLQSLLTEGRQKTEAAVQKLMQIDPRQLWRRRSRRPDPAAGGRSAAAGDRRVP